MSETSERVFTAWLVEAREERDRAEEGLDVARKRFAAVVGTAIDVEGWSTRKVGKALGLSGSRVHQIYKSVPGGLGQ